MIRLATFIPREFGVLGAGYYLLQLYYYKIIRKQKIARFVYEQFVPKRSKMRFTLYVITFNGVFTIKK